MIFDVGCLDLNEIEKIPIGEIEVTQEKKEEININSWNWICRQMRYEYSNFYGRSSSRSCGNHTSRGDQEEIDISLYNWIHNEEGCGYSNFNGRFSS